MVRWLEILCGTLRSSVRTHHELALENRRAKGRPLQASGSRPSRAGTLAGSCRRCDTTAVGRRTTTQTSPRNYPGSGSQREPKRSKAARESCGNVPEKFEEDKIRRQRMKWIALFLVAVGTLAGIVGSMVPASGQADKEAAPIFVIKMPAGYAIGSGSPWLMKRATSIVSAPLWATM
jgi:hypothetical protein